MPFKKNIRNFTLTHQSIRRNNFFFCLYNFASNQINSKNVNKCWYSRYEWKFRWKYGRFTAATKVQPFHVNIFWPYYYWINVILIYFYFFILELRQKYHNSMKSERSFGKTCDLGQNSSISIISSPLAIFNDCQAAS